MVDKTGKHVMRIVILVTGSILLLLGLVSMVTPIPGGTLLITVGVGMVICSSTTAARYIQVCRIKFDRFNRGMSWLENKMGDRLSAPLRRTRPDATTGLE